MAMSPPDLQFMVHSSEMIDKEGKAHRGSKITPLEMGSEPPEWHLRDFGFAAYSAPTVSGLRQVHFGKRIIYAFANPREHCDEVVVFRKGTDVQRKWAEDALVEPKIGLDMFFVMRQRQITDDTPLFKQFNGEWGFWESFFVPVLGDDTNTLQALSSMDPMLLKEHFRLQRLSVTCHTCPQGGEFLTIPTDLVVRHQVQVVCADMDQWTDLCNNLGEDMLLQHYFLIDNKHFKAGDECVEAYHEMNENEARPRLIKRNFEHLKLPVTLTFECQLRVADEWRPDTVSLQAKFDALSKYYNTDLLGGFSPEGRDRADPWHPMARLAVNALNKILSRYPDIQTVLDVGCGDMAWMSYFLHDHSTLQYVGVDMMPFCLNVNFRRFPKAQFILTDISNLSGIEVIPRGCDLVIAKDIFNYMALPDAMNSLKRIAALRPRFLLTHIHSSAENTGWEKRIDQHLQYTRYNYNKPPFSLPYPATDIQRISDDAYFVLYEVTPEGSLSPPPRVDCMTIPLVAESEIESYASVAGGELVDAESILNEPAAVEFAPDPGSDNVPTLPADDLGPRPAPDVPQQAEEPKVLPERKPIKGIPANEFRARCDLIFEKYDKDSDSVLNYEELVALMDAGGRRIDDYEAYSSLCGRLGCDARMGLSRKDVYKLFEKAPQSVWEEVYRSINPLAQMVKKGADKLPDCFLERPLHNFLFDDEEATAKVHIDFNSHLYYGAAESVTKDHVQAYFGKQRLEVHICAPGSYGANDLYVWRLVVTPLTGEIVPEECELQIKATTGRFDSKKVTIKIMKSKKKKWGKLGTASTGQRI